MGDRDEPLRDDSDRMSWERLGDPQRGNVSASIREGVLAVGLVESDEQDDEAGVDSLLFQMNGPLFCALLH